MLLRVGLLQYVCTRKALILEVRRKHFFVVDEPSQRYLLERFMGPDTCWRQKCDYHQHVAPYDVLFRELKPLSNRLNLL